MPKIYIVICITFYILFTAFLLVNKGYAFNNRKLAAQNNQKKIDLVYYDRFPYKKSYDGIKIPECIRAPARKGQRTSDVLLCKEHIALLRPASVIKLWQRQQRLKGYIPCSMEEFGIINVHAHITGVKEYTQVMKNNITPDSTHVTGKFIRYAREVNRYTIKDKQTNITSAVDATPNHPFYVTNKHAFVPISKVLSSDSLVTLSNHEAHLIRSGSNNFPFETNSKKNTLTRVYNIEIEKKHVYFISNLNLLVHNPCKILHDYYLLLKKKNIVVRCCLGNDPSVEISIQRDSIHLLSGLPSSHLNRPSYVLTGSGSLDPEIIKKIYRLGFSMQREYVNLCLDEASRVNIMILNQDAIITFRLRKPMPIEEYEEKFLPNIPDYYAQLSDATVSSTGTDNIIEGESSGVTGRVTMDGKILYGLNMEA